jgi:hypothetical protein
LIKLNKPEKNEVSKTSCLKNRAQKHLRKICFRKRSLSVVRKTGTKIFWKYMRVPSHLSKMISFSSTIWNITSRHSSLICAALLNYLRNWSQMVFWRGEVLPFCVMDRVYIFIICSKKHYIIFWTHSRSDIQVILNKSRNSFILYKWCSQSHCVIYPGTSGTKHNSGQRWFQKAYSPQSISQEWILPERVSILMQEAQVKY